MKRRDFINGISMFGAASLLSSPLLGSDWSAWRGPNYDGKSLEKDLITEWGPDGPSLIRETGGLGEGFSNLCFFGDRISTMGDFDDKAFLVVLDRKTAKVLWKKELGEGGPINGYVGTKSTPICDGTLIYALTQFGVLCAIDCQSQQIVWKKNYKDDFGGSMMMYNGRLDWGRSETPLLDGDRLICTPGGKDGVLVALNKMTGDLIWRSSDLPDAASYASPTPVVIDGVKQYLIMSAEHVAGFDPENGSLLWKFPFPYRLVHCTDPIYSRGIVFATSEDRIGSLGYSIRKKGSRFVVKKEYDLSRIRNTHHGLIEVNGVVYTTSSDGSFYCIDVQTGKILWEKRRMGGAMSLGFAAGNLLLRNENNGEIILLEANSEKCVEKGRFKQKNRSDKKAWTYPLVVDGKLFIRDQDTLFQYNMKKAI